MAPVPAHWQRLMQLIGRAFYAGECPPRDTGPEAPQGPRKGTNADFTGLGVVTLDALTRREWMNEDELASEIKAHPKVLRRVLRYLEQEQLLAREHRKEGAKRRRAGGGARSGSADNEGSSAAAPPGVAGDVVVENEDELPPRALLHSYCCVDYARALDVTQLRLFRLRRALKERLQDSKPVLEYACPGCGARYDTLQATYLIDFADGQFHCEHCGSVLASAEDAKSGGGEGARQERLKATKALQAKVEAQLRPLQACLDDIGARLQKGGKLPAFGSLAEWAQARFDAQQAAAGRGARNGASGARQPASVEVDLTGGEAALLEEEAAKELPPWLRAAAAAGGPSAPGGPSASSAGRSEDSTGTAAPSAAQPRLNGQSRPIGQGAGGAGGAAGGQQQASSTEQADIQAAYVRQYLESVRRRQAELAGQAAPRGAPDQAMLHDEKKGDAKRGSEGDTRLPKGEGGWVEAAPPPKLEPKPEAQKEEEDAAEWEVAEPLQQGADGSDVEWEEA